MYWANCDATCITISMYIRCEQASECWIPTIPTHVISWIVLYSAFAHRMNEWKCMAIFKSWHTCICIHIWAKHVLNKTYTSTVAPWSDQNDSCVVVFDVVVVVVGDGGVGISRLSRMSAPMPMCAEWPFVCPLAFASKPLWPTSERCKRVLVLVGLLSTSDFTPLLLPLPLSCRLLCDVVFVVARVRFIFTNTSTDAHVRVFIHRIGIYLRCLCVF